jgi:hypothetical protein
VEPDKMLKVTLEEGCDLKAALNSLLSLKLNEISELAAIVFFVTLDMIIEVPYIVQDVLNIKPLTSQEGKKV